jgi:hypothetical protein
MSINMQEFQTKYLVQLLRKDTVVNVTLRRKQGISGQHE